MEINRKLVFVEFYCNMIYILLMMIKTNILMWFGGRRT